MDGAEPDVQGEPVTRLVWKPTGYRAYILRCWAEPSLTAGQPEAHFRCSLEDPTTGERRGFVNLQALTEFLQSSMKADRMPPRKPGLE